jgi:hypothetical protein
MSATVIVKNDRCTGEYDMFDLRSVELHGDVGRAQLHGPLFLEVGETVTIRVGEGKGKVELKAKVQSVAADDSAMGILFVDLDERGRTALAGLKLSAKMSSTKSSPEPKTSSSKK